MKRPEPEPRTLLSYLPPDVRREYPERVTVAEALRGEVNAIVVNSPETKATASEILVRVKKKYREIFDQQAEILDPLKESEAATRKLFAIPLAALSEAERSVKGKLETYALTEKRRADELRRRADEEARKAREAVEKAAADERERLRKEKEVEARKEAKAAGFTPAEREEYAKLAGEDAAASVPAPPTILAKPTPAPPAKSLQTESGRVDTKFFYDYEVENVYELLAAEPTFVECTPRRRAILDRLKATEGKPIPGLKIIERANIAGNV